MTKYTLKLFPKTSYTQMEFHLFNMLPQDGSKVTSNNIADMRKALGNWDVAHPLATITVTMNRLIDKVMTNREPFRIRKAGKKKGHAEVEYWIEQMESAKEVVEKPRIRLRGRVSA
jgi:hypothetical protein